MSRVGLFFIGLAAVSGVVPAAPNPKEIVDKSVAATKTDWAEAGKYSFLEHDVEEKRQERHAKTYRVLMIDGSPFNVVTAIDGHPLSGAEKAAEQRKLQREIAKRQSESERERDRRIAKYKRERDRDHRMLQEMLNAFTFRLAGEAEVNGHDCLVLNAEPRPDFEPEDREGRVLKGMKGQLWIDKGTYQWVKVHAEVMRPVTFYGFLAKVGPGTEFDLEQEPVENGIWLPKSFHVRVRATALGFFNENSDESETYRDYQPMPQALARLEAGK